jgi:hypothetical protein
VKLIVSLPDHLLEEAAFAGTRRRLEIFRNQRRNTYRQKSGAEKTYWDDHIDGAIAEMAVCLAYGFQFQDDTDRIGAPDAGPIEVRSVKKAGYALLTYAKDLPHQQLVLCRVSKNRVLLEGWATSDEIRTWGRPVVGSIHGLRPDELHGMETIGYDIVDGEYVREWHPDTADR